ncbi:molecular chaperone [Pseudomonas sp. 5P_3.1_Bac2]|uniref:molecular chaperone n=1 Tax=Pseudomonas sp. 5P_3.1_Bac2 TaxID=2971617 RepID=UPI0021C7B841|nr:molecular chaperone [Pseudomonas sp. 5P_3.1_Bac2]MCU1718305.1 molecular chaperone [Pseudomonas sp. 5P_3.1_Bac2]
MDSHNAHLLLRVTTPHKHSLSFSEANPRSLKTWVEGLPKANIGETARQLYQALQELNQLQAAAETRLQMLEVLRPEVYFVCKHLERHYLNQAIVLDERPRKVANLCQALQNHLAVGYKLIVSQQASQTGREAQQLLLVALQRALYSLCGPLMRANQLYCPIPEGLWLELHQLYQIAFERDLHHDPVRDLQARHGHSLSVEQCYVVALLLGCARCNQMRQNAIAQLTEALESWSSLVSLQHGDLNSSLFAVAPQVDGPPRYRSLFQAHQQYSALGIDPNKLVQALKAHLQLSSDKLANSPLLVPRGLSHDMLQHLAAAWGDIAERTFQRSHSQGSLTLCIGMCALHYYLADKRQFNQVLQRANTSTAAVFKTRGKDDVWENAYDTDESEPWEKGLNLEEIQYQKHPHASGSEAIASYPCYEVSIVNISPGGYCLSWPSEVPSQLQAGELLGVQSPQQKTWSIAVVRWIRQVRGGGTQMGIELIAPHAQACGLQLVRSAEHTSQFLRALLLPEISAISRPASLITACLPFQEGHRVCINTEGSEQAAILTCRLTSTGSFSQFEYRGIALQPHEEGISITPKPGQPVAGEEDFDSLWKSL